MNPYLVAVSFLAVLIAAGLGAGLFFKMQHSALDMEEKIQGIWANESNTLRMLIYSLESTFHGEVVWTRQIDEGILGSRIIGHMKLKYFSRCEGLYTDPYTKTQFKFLLKLKDKGLLHLHLFEKSNHQLAKVEIWKQV